MELEWDASSQVEVYIFKDCGVTFSLSTICFIEVTYALRLSAIYLHLISLKHGTIILCLVKANVDQCTAQHMI